MVDFRKLTLERAAKAKARKAADAAAVETDELIESADAAMDALADEFMPEPRPAVTLTPEQQNAVDHIIEWAKGEPFGEHMTLGGLAGTGKTTLVRFIYDALAECGMAPIVGTPTGKAAHVLRQKGIFAQTLHSMIYDCVGQDAKGGPIFEFIGLIDGTPFLIADEASMVNQTLHDDIKRTRVPTLYIGDYGQLPPVGKDPGIMAQPDITLQEIHRQALDNPIVALAHHFREGGKASSFNTRPDDRILILPRRDYDEAFGHDALLCGYNRTRIPFNHYYLQKRAGIDLACERFGAGDTFQAICTRNNRKLRIFNGLCGRMTVREAWNTGRFFADFEPDGEDRVVEVVVDPAPMFGQQFDFRDRDADPFDLAYVLTTHKAQGSEWDRVTVLDEAFGPPADQRRWRYTAATRAKERLCWLT